MSGNRSRLIFPTRIFFHLTLAALFIASCIPARDFSVFSQNATEIIPKSPIIEIKRAEIVFEVTIPDTVASPVYLDIVDEVAGIPWNPLRLQMEKKENNIYSISIPITTGSTIKYRYVLGSSPSIVEKTSRGTSVRYRMIHISDPAIILDKVTGWDAPPENLEMGRVTGKVTDEDTGNPLPDILITIDGLQTLSSADGSFILEYVPVGTHQLVAYSTTGQYRTFQQGALISKNATTQTDIMLSTSKFVDLTFVVASPTEHPPDAPIRMIGNTYSFGNTFANLNGGVSALASRSPAMQIRDDGQYLLSVSLPSGMDLRYTYTLGDGFWNTELNPEGHFRIRQLIVPNQDATIEDQIINWGTDQNEIFNFEVKVPKNTPSRDVISIQFAPFGWTEPIPLWPLGDNTWAYRLYSPPQIGSNLEYRYCRNEQCEVAYDVNTSNPKTYHSLRGNATGQINDRVESWVDWSTTDQPTAIAAVNIQPRNSSFTAGIEFLSDYHPSWQPYFRNAFDYVGDIGGNQIILDPTWTYTSNTPPVLEPIPGKDMLTADLQQAIFWANEKGFDTVLFPQVRFPDTELDWWKTAKIDEEWWNNWFDRYSRYLIHFAEIAEDSGVSGLIIGEPGSKPSWPGGMLSDNSVEFAPANAQEKWLRLIGDLRAHFSGQLLWAVSFPNGLKTDPELLSEMDAVYLVWEAPISDSTAPTQSELVKNFNKLLNKRVVPFYETINKPIWIGLTYPSIDGAAQGCIKEGKNCIPVYQYFTNTSHLSNDQLDLQEQADIYNAAFAAINKQEWIAGVTSRGFYPPASLKDNSYSIHGKPASDVVWYWYPRFTGVVK